MNDRLKHLESMPVPKAVLTSAIPTMLSMLLTLVYNMADLFFIGQTGDDLQVAAISLATPMFLLYMSFGNVFGIGGASFLSRSLGQGRFDFVKKISSFCFWTSIGIGIAISAGVYLSMDTIVTVLGASDTTSDMVSTYLSIISVSGFCIIASYCVSALARAEGNPKQAMGGMMLGNLLNIILDPVFILWLDMGVKGAAVATLIGNLASLSYYLVYLLRTPTILDINPRHYTAGEGVMKNVISIGVPASLASILMGTSHVVLNSLMAAYGDLAVAGVGVAVKVGMLTTMVCIGIGLGIQPLLGYSIGAQNEARYHETFRFSLLFACGLSGTLTLLCYLLMPQIVGAFVSEPDSFDYAYRFSQVIISTSIASAMLFVLANALQSAGAAAQSLIINISRQGLIFIPMLFVMDSVVGINGLVFAQPISDISTLILATILYRRVSKTFFNKKTVELV